MVVKKKQGGLNDGRSFSLMKIIPGKAGGYGPALFKYLLSGAGLIYDTKIFIYKIPNANFV